MKKPDLASDLGNVTILPSSKTARSARGAVASVMGYWVPIYCANCGADGGMVPEDTTTFAFYLCNDCVMVHGVIEGTVMTPDEVFWQRVHNEQMEKYGRILEPGELDDVATANASPLATLLNEGLHSEKG